MTPLRVLFVKESQGWPRAAGHDVHGYHLMRGLAGRGHAVSLATLDPPTSQALTGLPLAGVYALGHGAPAAPDTAPHPTAHKTPDSAQVAYNCLGTMFFANAFWLFYFCHLL